MGRLSVQDVELRYPSSGSNNQFPWFSIKNDRETKQIRFLYNTIDDVYFEISHDITMNGRIQSVECLNSDGQNPQGCPLCAHGHDQIIRLYVPVLDLSDNKVKIWSRPKGFLGVLQSIAGRNNPISGVVFEVQRIGAPRDTKTQYIPMPITQNDGLTVQAMGLQLPPPGAGLRQMDLAQMDNLAKTLDGFANAMPAFGNQPSYQPYGGQQSYNSNGFAPQQPVNTFSQAPQQQYGAPTQPQFGAPMQQQQRPITGSEPVRRAPQSVPNYTQGAQPQFGANMTPQPTTPMAGIPQQQPQGYAPTAPMQGIPTQPPIAPQQQQPPVDMNQPYGAQGAAPTVGVMQNNMNDQIDDDELPF